MVPLVMGGPARAAAPPPQALRRCPLRRTAGARADAPGPRARARPGHRATRQDRRRRQPDHHRAPPRTGKTGGLILPTSPSWNPGPGAGRSSSSIPRATPCAARGGGGARRSARLCAFLDPLGLSGDSDRWDPLLGLDPEDVLELQSMARALPPDVDQTTEEERSVSSATAPSS